jgi:hypothetical protein
MCCSIPFTPTAQNRQTHRDGKEISGCQGLREGVCVLEGEGSGFLSEAMKIFWN